MDTCPNCGWSEVKTLKKFTHEMAEYVDPKTGKLDGVYNTNDEEITVQPKGAKEQKKLVRKDLYVAPVAPAAPVKEPVKK